MESVDHSPLRLGTSTERFRVSTTQFGTPTTQFRSPITEFGTPLTEFRVSPMQLRTPLTQFRTSLTQLGSPITQFVASMTRFRSAMTKFGSSTSRHGASKAGKRHHERVYTSNGLLARLLKAVEIPGFIKNNAYHVMGYIPWCDQRLFRHKFKILPLKVYIHRLLRESGIEKTAIPEKGMVHPCLREPDKGRIARAQSVSLLGRDRRTRWPFSSRGDAGKQKNDT
uniref:Uncharacterized protein n=1 Tax=Candidatus Kentrum eta TaxID=2126337 RepID=A0A450U8L6_9GAMM|nr:MAG: hypothetical protein BECKH772A_GA0070896_1000735 [Candidatus Kentron sp. H]VFJ90221.1 MAG: hypothetical protein BECKH772B_GA0070898_1000835 [Candidatus Kentron sp. H]VFJ96576.1 MAG: hypothetical protein BECKH772C_GA0070978_1000735 [Candidatus Kentron sp. H]